MVTRQRGVLAHQEVDPQKHFRDLRPVGRRAQEILSRDVSLMVIVLVGGALMWIFPAMAEILALGTVLTLWWATAHADRLSVRVPVVAHLPDVSNPDPVTGKPQPGQGTYFLANEEDTQKEVWFAPNDVNTHVLMFGTTGGGKTEALLSMAYNAIIQGSGFIFVDGKGDNSTATKIFSMLRSVGREDDLLVVNYMTSGRSVSGRQRNRLTNKMNPYAMGTPQGLTNLTVSLMDDAGSDPMWKSRAMALIGALMQVLAHLRDKHGEAIDAQRIRDMLTLPRVIALSRRKDLPPEAQVALRGYLETLPGYVDGKEPDNTQFEQHGYLIMQFTKVMSMLADTYGHIFGTPYGEVEFKDIIYGRRVLLVTLPSLELPPDELANVGKLIVTSLRMVMATGLGSELEGSVREIVTSKPTNSDEPYLTILDEYGYYVVKGAAVMPAQARSLKFMMVFAGQDLPSFEKNNNAEEAASTVGNCNIKMFLKTEDPHKTSELYIKAAGEVLVSEGGGFERKTDGLFDHYIDQRQAHIRQQARGHWLDIKNLDPGQVRILFRDSHIRARMFFVNPDTFNELEIRLNHFLGVAPPDTEAVARDLDSIGELGIKLGDDNYCRALQDEVVLPIRLALLAGALQMPEGRRNGQAAAAWVAGLDHATLESALAMGDFDGFGDGEGDETDDDEMSDDGLRTDVFGAGATERTDRHGFDERDDGGSLLPDAAAWRQRLADMRQWERAAAPQATADDAETTDDGLLEQGIRDATAYPQHQPDAQSPADLLDIINTLGDDGDDADDEEDSGDGDGA